MDNVTHMPDRDSIKQEAGLWLARLDRGGLSTREQAELQRWMGTSSFHADYLNKLVKNWDNMDVLSELAELFPLKDAPRDTRQSTPRPAGRVGAWIGAALGASALAAAALLTLNLQRTVEVPAPTPPELATETYQTAIGEHASFQLSDGSTVTLNTNSRLNVNFHGTQRKVTLLRGEANFNVAKDPHKPFVVHVGSGAVWAVGTQFNVRLFDSEVDVTVLEGTVKVFAGLDESPPQLSIDSSGSADGRELVLDAGKSVRYDRLIESPEVFAPEVIEQKLAWQQGSLIFKGESLQQAIAEISRYTKQEIIITDPSISDIPIGGRFKTEDIDALIASLNLNFQIQSEQVSPNRIHLYRK